MRGRGEARWTRAAFKVIWEGGDDEKYEGEGFGHMKMDQCPRLMPTMRYE